MARQGARASWARTARRADERRPSSRAARRSISWSRPTASIDTPRLGSPRKTCTGPAARSRARSPPSSFSGWRCRRPSPPPGRFVREAIEAGRDVDARRRAWAADSDEASRAGLIFLSRRPCASLDQRRATHDQRRDRFLCLPPGFRQFRRGGEGEELSSSAGRLGRSASPMSSGPPRPSRTGATRRSTWSAPGVIAAVANALERRPFPFIFGGDGASFAVSPSEATAAAQALAAMATFAHAEFELDLRVATIPVRDIRAAGRDVRIARFAVSEHCNYAMFAGGGLSWFEERAKRGDYRATPCPAWRASRPFRTLLPLGRRPGEVWRRAFGDRLAARRRSALPGPRGRGGRKWRSAAAQSGRPITVESLGVGAAGQAIALEACVGQGLGRLAPESPTHRGERTTSWASRSTSSS